MSLRLKDKTNRTTRPLHSTGLDEDQAKTSRASFSTTVAKALNIMEILASCDEAGVSLTELTVSLNMPKSTRIATWQRSWN